MPNAKNSHRWLKIGSAVFSAFLIASIAFSLIRPTMNALASSILTVAPISWNVIGLDSNDVTSGPNEFPVGARVCNAAGADTATALKANLVWDSANSNINLSGSSLTTITIDSLAGGSCADIYFNVAVTRTSAAYDTTRKYHIVVADSAGITARTPGNRELYVEHLVSQSRNSVTSISVNGTLIPAGGRAVLIDGQTYTIKLTGATSTNGYNQLESFLNLPNTIFQVLGVTSTYAAASGGFTSPTDKLYADACGWINDTTSLNYRSCTSDAKAGGVVTNTYTVKILEGASGVQSIGSLFYDFSGSSYHYNSDYSFSARTLSLVDPAQLGISKSFSPSTISAGGTSTLTLTINNPYADPFSGLSFSDTLPAGMVIANPNGAAASGCGSPTITATAGSDTITFSNGTVAASSTCNVRVNVTVAANGTYNNTSGTLKFTDLGQTIDTGNTASSTLTASVYQAPTATPSSCTASQMVKWSFTGSTTLNYDAGSKASDVSTAVASFETGTGTVGGTTVINSTVGNPTVSGGSGPNAWDTIGYYKGNVTFNNGLNTSPGNSAYMKFAIDTSYYRNITFSFSAFRTNNGPTDLYIYYGTSGTAPETYKTLYTNKVSNSTWSNVSTSFLPTETSTSGLTYFYVYGYNANNYGAGTDLYLDDITFSGCKAAPKVPTITKSFSTSPVTVGGTSRLTFTLSNPNLTVLSGVKFTDSLPDGLVVASTPSASTTCSGASFSPTAGSMTIDFSGGTIPAGSGSPIVNGSCTASVNVKVTKGGTLTNTTGYISATDAGTNTTSTGYATANVTGTLLPPSMTKSFAPASMLTGASSTLTFIITNPNPQDSLTGISFSDSLPAGLVVAGSPSASTTCTGATFAPSAGAASISLSGGTVAAGSSCTASVKVTAASAGTYNNTSGAVSSTNGGTGNTASASLSVTAPTAKLSTLKQISTSATGPWSANLNVSPSTNIYYRFIVENTGDLSLNNIGIVDPSIDTSGCSFTNPLTAGDYTTCVVGPLTSGASAGKYTNIAYAKGFYTPGSTPVEVDSANSTANYYIYPDLTASVVDNVNGNVQVGAPFTWTTTIENIGSMSAAFTDGQTIFSQTLPGGANYGTPTPGSFTNVTNSGNISCAIASGTLTCRAIGGTVTIGTAGSFTVSLGVTPLSQVTLTSMATADPNSLITESNENNNTSSDSVKTLADPNKANPTITTNATVGTSGTAGTALTSGDTATISGGSSPTGTITFTLFSDSGCSVPVSGMSGSGTISGGSANWSGSWTPAAAGTYYWQAFYAGDSANNGFTTDCGEANEEITIGKASPTVTTTASPTSAIWEGAAATIGDTATINGGASPTGTVSFTLYSNSSCTTAVPGISGSSAVSGGSATWSSGWTPSTAGTYYWIASYSGDTNNNAYTTACSDANEQITVQAKGQPAITTLASPTTGTVGQALTTGDSATITGGSSPAGDITFTLYSDEACSVPVSGMSGTGTISGGAASWSKSWIPTAAGTYYWQASYPGDANNQGYTTACGGTNEEIVIGKASPSISSTTADPATGTAATALTVGDSAVLAGGYSPTGDVTFTLYSDDACSVPVTGMSGSGTISSGTASWSASWTPAAAGTYYWKASYAGDTNNNSFTTSCGGTNEEITIGKASPTITTTAVPSKGTINVSAATGDTAVLSGGASPTGSVTFTLYSDASCSTAVTGMSGSGTINSGEASWSADWAPTAVGTYYWKAAYAGDDNNNGYTTICGDTNETLAVQAKGAPYLTTTASPSTTTVGTSITAGDTAALVGGLNPTGTVTFTLYSDDTCTVPVSGMSGVGTISAGSASFSKSWTPTSAGTYYWTAFYSGDTFNDAYTSACSDDNEQIEVSKASPTISSTTADPNTGTAGTTVTAGDSAVLSGGYAPGGSVTFSLYSDAACTVPVPGMSGSGTVSSGTASWSKSWTPAAEGTYYWLAEYSGDANNNSDTTACGDANEDIVIGKATPSISTTASPTTGIIGASMTAGDTATLTGAVDPTGSITFTLYSDSTCSTPVAGISGSGNLSGNSASWSTSWTPAAAGTYYWQASYPGDANNASALSTCNDTDEQVVIDPKATPVLTTSASPKSGTINDPLTAGDTATLSGGYSPTGSVTFTLYSDSSCTLPVSAMSGTGAISGGTASWSSSWTPPNTGVYYWQASYSGDASNNNVTTECNATNEQITIGKASPTMTTSASPTSGIAGTFLSAGDSAVITGGVNPTGTVTFTLYRNSTCTLPVLGVSGSGTVSSGAANWSGSWTPGFAGTYYWQAVYSGDNQNNGYTTACGGIDEEIDISAISGSPSISLEKSADPLTYTAVDDVIQYSYLVRNTGNIALNNILVTDDKETVDCPGTSLAVSEYMTCTASHKITDGDLLLDSITNTAQVTANEIPTPVTDQAVVTKAAPELLGSISGVLYLDSNSDGTYQSTESLLGTVVIIQLVDGNGTVVSQTSTSNGAYSFSGVPAGSYHVVEWTNPAGYLPTSPDDVQVSVTAGAASEVDFGHTQLSSGSYKVDGYVFDDADLDTQMDAGELPLAGIKITLYGSNLNLVGVAYTDANGHFVFNNLPGGVYVVVETDGSDYPYSSTSNAKMIIAGNATAYFGDYAPADPTCEIFSDPMVDVKLGAYPETVVSGESYYLQFQVANNGNSSSGAVSVYSQIPAMFDIHSVNVYYRADINNPAPADAYSVSLSGNSLVINFTDLTPGNVYEVLISATGNSLAENNSGEFTVNLQSSGQSCGNLPANNSGSISVGGGIVQGFLQEITSGKTSETGFAPDLFTSKFANLKDLFQKTDAKMTLEISSLGVKMPVQGIPFENGGWDTSWLGMNAGWLNGTAFPGYTGNTVIVGHVYLADGLPGPMVNLEQLKWGDRITITNGTQKLIYAVRSVSVVDPNDASIMKHEDHPVLTLVTCKGYNAATGHYNKRVVVKADLLQVLETH